MHGYKVQHAGLTHLCYNSTKNGVMQDLGQPCAIGRAVCVPWAWLSVQHLHEEDTSTFLFIHPMHTVPPAGSSCPAPAPRDGAWLLCSLAHQQGRG